MSSDGDEPFHESAEAAPRPRAEVHLAVDLYTSFPTLLGAKTTLEVPGRIRFSLSGGVLPAVYLSAIDDYGVREGWYDRETADLIEAVLHNSLLVSAHVGWRPFPKAGLQLEGGYGFIGLGGGLTGAQVLGEASGYDMSWLPDTGLNYVTSAGLHRVEASAGWEVVIKKHVHVQVDLGYSRTLAAKTSVDPDFDVPWLLEDTEAHMERQAEQALHDKLVAYMHSPILAIGAGWRF